jgi:magnesium-transporting ATPase (P-type)
MAMNRPVREILDNINVPQAKNENKAYLAQIGGALGLASKLGISNEQVLEYTGLTARQVVDMRAQFGDNVFPESPMEGLLSIFFGAFTDTTLQILLAAAIVSLGVQTYQEPEKGWIEGVAIFIAVIAVATITSISDYSKELQFRALEKSTQKDEKTTVVRDGVKQLIATNDVVVGDMIVLNVSNIF